MNAEPVFAQKAGFLSGIVSSGSPPLLPIALKNTVEIKLPVDYYVDVDHRSGQNLQLFPFQCIFTI